MAWMHFQFRSAALRFTTAVNVVVPEGLLTGGQPGDRPRAPVLYLLHGLGDNHSTWMRRTSIERYAEKKGLIVIMPEVQRGYYLNLRFGAAYWTFVSEEIPDVCARLFPISEAREETFAAGFSMGGYGAFRLGLLSCHRFGAVGSLAGALDLADWWAGKTAEADILEQVGARGIERQIVGTSVDLFHLLESLSSDEKAALPRFYQHCGVDDMFIEHNRRFRDGAAACGIDLTYRESPGGHSWEYVDAAVQDLLEWLPV